MSFISLILSLFFYATPFDYQETIELDTPTCEIEVVVCGEDVEDDYEWVFIDGEWFFMAGNAVTDSEIAIEYGF